MQPLQGDGILRRLSDGNLYRYPAATGVETYSLNVTLHEASELLVEITITASKSKFSAEKTELLPTFLLNSSPHVCINCSMTLPAFPPYASGNTFGGRDGRSNTFTVDGANLNNNFGLSSDLPEAEILFHWRCH